MQTFKQKIIDAIIEVEGGYVDDASDSGGKTRFGITEQVARKEGYQGSMRDLPRDLAFYIYSKKYWDVLAMDSIHILSPLIAEELVDTGVNQGTGRAAKFLQRALNVLNNEGKHYSDITIDGDVGPATINALKSYLRIRNKTGEKVLHKVLNSLQGAFYISLAERRQKDERFIYGWFANRIS